MFGVNVTDYDRKVWEEELCDFLPDRIVDAHVHIYKEEMQRIKPENRKGCVNWPHMVAPDLTIEDMKHSFSQMFPGKNVKAVIMGMPTCRLDEVNDYALSCAKQEGIPALYCTNWDTTKDEIRAAMAQGFAGIKPYLNNCPSYIPEKEVRIFDYLTKEHMEVMDELGGIVMLHIPRSLRLRDPVNLAQMMEIEEKYPNAKVIIAHIGRAYVPSDIGDAFEVLKNTKNMLFDFTANTLTLAMTKCIETVGPKRIMFGSDMPITKMRMYRICDEDRYVNVVPRGFYGDVSGDPNMREVDDWSEMTTFMYEELRAFKKCAEELSLSKADVEDILCNNAANLFGIKF
ncbi:MAG: amidohydrolase family protein [Clostridia bacterium]|nr:amidohydrolase family protein [Clostridia bacterium]